MKIIKKNGGKKPERISYTIRLGRREYTIAFEVVTHFDEVAKIDVYEWNEATFTPGIPEYGDVVAAIIKGRYTDDEMTAIINNHLLDGDDKTNLAEWNAMQEWRTEAKKQAKEILEEINKME